MPAVHAQDLAQLERSLQVCRRIFGGMLAFARGSSRRVRYGQVRPAVETALAILRDSLERRGIQLSIEIPPDTAAVACGQGDLEQVFLNLLTNAREAMPAGGRLVVRAHADTEIVTISVADTGCGIPPEHLQRVQEPFFTTKPHGNGLGLSICRSILWETGGKLTIDSDPSSWNARRDLGAAREHSSARNRMNPARILVVDDEPGMLRAVERILGGTHHVVTSRSSFDAVAVAGRFDPELAILDVRMKELDGFELMARLHAQKADLDVILMTGSVDDLDEKLVRAIRGEAFYFIQKPFDREVLRTLVDRCLELRWRREERRRYLRRLETELAEARAFQQSLLPAREAVVGPLALWCRYSPCSELGGDLYDYACGASGQAALLVADVSGHGTSAAMLTEPSRAPFDRPTRMAMTRPSSCNVWLTASPRLGSIDSSRCLRPSSPGMHESCST